MEGTPQGENPQKPEGTQPESPQPGWYPDSEVPGGQRYWDGTQWTENRAPAAQAGGTAMAVSPESRQWAMFAHLSALAAMIIGLNWLGPLIIYMMKKDEDPFVADQAREALNFNLSFFLYGVVGFIATFVLILVIVGVLLIPVLAALGVAWVVLVIIAAMRSNKGEAYRYPVTIRFVNA